jgi:membrane-anchored protein YejM (alkaline phosphatase superfamily)
LDTQFHCILTYLEDHDLLDSTIILITGDHGEAFMEKGRWGHGSDYSEEQTRAPLVLWVPGTHPREVNRMTSHLDIPATLLPLLGVTNPPEDYSLGFDLLGNTVREFSVLCDWDKVTYVDSKFKAVFPTKVYGFAYQDVTTKDDVEVRDKASFYEIYKDRLLQVMREMNKFSNRETG